MIELEKKVPLSEDEYAILMRLFGKDALSFTQTNYYFDTDDFKMNNKGITYRIREKNGKYQATVKKHERDVKDKSIEISKEARNERDKRLFKGKGIKPQGSLVTERTVIHQDDISKVVLDKNFYLDTTDYEMEIEYLFLHEDRAEYILRYYAKALRAFDRKIDIPSFCERAMFSKNKSTRFFERKRRVTTMKGGDNNGLNYEADLQDSKK